METKISKQKPSIYLSNKEANKFMDFDVDDKFVIVANARISTKSKRQYKHNSNIETHTSIDLELSDIEIKKDLKSNLRNKKF